MKIGVDPLASNKGFWSDILGIGDFYYELSVQIIEECLRTRNINGGLIDINELCALIKNKRKKQANAISTDDIKCAIAKVKGLGNGFGVITIGRKEMVKSVPMEFNRDHTTILSHCQSTACGTITQLMRKTKWPKTRVEQTLNMMLNEGIAWIEIHKVVMKQFIGSQVFGKTNDTYNSCTLLYILYICLFHSVYNTIFCPLRFINRIPILINNFLNIYGNINFYSLRFSKYSHSPFIIPYGSICSIHNWCRI